MAGKTLQSTIEIAGTLNPSLQQAIKQAVDRLEEMSQETRSLPELPRSWRPKSVRRSLF